MSKTAEIWVVDDDQAIRWVLDKAFEKAGYQTRLFGSATEVRDAIKAYQPQVILSDVRMPGEDGLSLMAGLKEIHPEIPVIIMTAHSDLDSAVKAYDQGAFEYLPKPFDINEAVEQVERALRVSGEPEQTGDVPEPEVEIIGKAPAMQEVFRAIGRLSKSGISVLINGESGTGKELVAAALHRHSPRAEKPFIALNMAAIPKDLIESELFGHEKGAFTGAQSRRAGRFEQANEGTLFLDEIGDMPAETQTRLLRVLADGEFYPVGATQPVRVDVRIIAATHQDLEGLVAEGRFREDLFHRLNVIRIHIPALRDRKEDISLLMEHFLGLAAMELQAERKFLSSDALSRLEAFSWPGNVRQLENTARWLTVMAAGKEILLADLPPELESSASDDGAVGSSKASDWTEALRDELRSRLQGGDEAVLVDTVETLEKLAISAALEHTAGKRQEAAKLLGWGRNTLTRKIARHGL